MNQSPGSLMENHANCSDNEAARKTNLRSIT